RVLKSAESLDTLLAMADAELRIAGHLDLGNQVADGWIPSREVDAGFLTDQAATAVAPNKILRPQRAAFGQLDVDTGVVLHEPRPPPPAMDRHGELAAPGRQYVLDAVLPERESIVVAGRKVTDVEPNHRETCDLSHLPFSEKAIGDSALVEHLDGARMQTAGARAGEVLARASLDYCDVDDRQCQLGSQHKPSRACARDQDVGIPTGHESAPVVRIGGLRPSASPPTR